MVYLFPIAVYTYHYMNILNQETNNQEGSNVDNLENTQSLQRSDVEILKKVDLIQKSLSDIRKAKIKMADTSTSPNELTILNTIISEEEQKINKLEADKKTLQEFKDYINAGGTLPEMISEGKDNTAEEPGITAHDHDEERANAIRAKYNNQ